MKTHCQLVIFCFWALVIWSPSLGADRPNIIVVLADDLGYSDLGCYGGEIPTPHIDALAKGGVRLSQMYNSARCCPTRASLMTGLYPTQAGIGDFTTNKPTANKGPGYLGRLREDCATMAEILFTSDNGACYEWGPFGFDGVSRTGETILYTEVRLHEIGGPGTHHSYGSGWANLGNTPLRMYKHITHEGGINSPFIAHWPKGIDPRTDWVHDPVHVMDIVPTILAATKVQPIAKRNEVAVQPIEGRNLLPTMRGIKLAERGIGFDHQGAHAWRKGDWKIVWSKRLPTEIKWELYNIAEDRCERNDLASQHPDRVKEMVAEWTEWAKRVGVIWKPLF